MKISWIAITFNSVLGFGGLAGASLRGMLYKRHTDADNSRLVSSIAWMVPLTLTGLSVLAWLPALSIVPAGTIVKNYHWLQYAIWGMAAYTPAQIAYFLFSKKEGRLQNLLLTIAVSTFEWLAALTALWGIATILGSEVRFTDMLAVFIAAAIAGVISLVPGGLGSFDLIAVVGMAHMGIANNKILVILFFYRLCYYIAPFILGLVLASTEAVSHTKSVLLNSKYSRHFRTMKALPEFLVSNMSYWALAFLVFIAGVILLFSASTPGALERTAFAERIFSSELLHLSHQLSVAAGIALLFLSRYIYLKDKDAYILACLILLAGALFTFSKGFDFEEALFLLGIMEVMWLSKNQFYLDHVPLSLPAFLGMGVITIVSLIAYVSVGYFDQPYETLRLPAGVRDLLVKEPGELASTAVNGLILALLFNGGGFYILRKKRLARSGLKNKG